MNADNGHGSTPDREIRSIVPTRSVRSPQDSETGIAVRGCSPIWNELSYRYDLEPSGKIGPDLRRVPGRLTVPRKHPSEFSTRSSAK